MAKYYQNFIGLNTFIYEPIVYTNQPNENLELPGNTTHAVAFHEAPQNASQRTHDFAGAGAASMARFSSMGVGGYDPSFEAENFPSDNTFSKGSVINAAGWAGFMAESIDSHGPEGSQIVYINAYRNYDFPFQLTSSFDETNPTRNRDKTYVTASFFNALMIYRNGPYGWPMWKQVRTGENKIIRKQRKHNIMTVVTEPGDEFTFKAAGKIQTSTSRYGATREFNETPVVSKYKPLIVHAGRQVLLEDDSTRLQRFTLKATYGNNTSYFNNPELNKLMALKSDASEEYDHVKDMYLDGGLDSESPIDSVELIRYRETIYPPLKYTGKRFTRKRVNFNFPWKDKKPDRKGDVNFDYGFGRQDYANDIEMEHEVGIGYYVSKWPLDTYDAFLNETFDDPGDMHLSGLYYHQWGAGFTAGVLRSYGPSMSGSGLLQSKLWANNSSNAVQNMGGIMRLPNNWDQNTAFHPFYAYPHTLPASSSVVAPSGMKIEGINFDLASTAYGDLPPQWLPRGDTHWDAPAQSGKAPFFNSYDEYSDGITQKGKDYTIIPEFRITNHVKRFLQSGSLDAIPEEMELSGNMTGLKSGSSGLFYDIYSNSDFLKHFDVVQEDHKGFVEPIAITLRCKALKKLLPYEGFYPVQRTIELGQQFFNSFYNNCFIRTDSYHSSAKGDGYGDDDGWLPATGSYKSVHHPGAATDAQSRVYTPAFQNLMTPMFAPGVLYNAIKGGVAVEFPTVSASISQTGSMDGISGVMTGSDDGPNHKDNKQFTMYRTGSYAIGTGSTGGDPARQIFDHFIPFESLVDPEQHLAGKQFGSISPHPMLNNSSSIKWDGGGDLTTYKLMAHNFLAECADFFLQDGQFTTISSKPSDDPNVGLVETGKTYMMRIKMYKSSDMGSEPVVLANGNAYSPPQHNSGSHETFTMYSRPSAFGPPVATTYPNFVMFSGSDPKVGENYTHTPPYYNGESWCDVTFSPASQSKQKYTIQEIIASSSFSFKRFHSHRDAAKNFVLVKHVNNQLSASVNLRSMGQIKKVDLLDDSTSDKVQVAVDVSDSSAKARWIIQSKFETPHLNFNHLSGSESLSLPNSAPHACARGMWHQYGKIERDPEKGIFLQVTDVPDGWAMAQHDFDKTTIKNLRSLADLCGFDKVPRRMGKTAESKIIREAVVAIPFIQADGNRKFFALSRKDITNAIASDKSKQKLVGRSVRAMVDKMKRYVFPPSMDFVNNANIDPFAMYIFEFKHKLAKKDLADIWQNLYPDITEKFEEATSTISHRLLAHELLGGGAEYETGTDKDILDVNQKGTPFPDKIQWMVFKVKQRAKNNYYEKIVGKPNFIEAIHGKQIEEGRGQPIAPNWPYDFFSLVELVKIEAEIGLGEFQEVKKPPVKAKVRKKRKKRKPKIVKRAARVNTNVSRPGRNFGLRNIITPGTTED